jgi:hypothetical protein
MAQNGCLMMTGKYPETTNVNFLDADFRILDENYDFLSKNTYDK